MPRNPDISFELQQIAECRELYKNEDRPLIESVLKRAEYLEHERQQNRIQLEQSFTAQTWLRAEISALEDTMKALTRGPGEECLADAYLKSQRAKYAAMYGLKEEVSS